LPTTAARVRSPLRMDLIPSSDLISNQTERSVLLSHADQRKATPRLRVAQPGRPRRAGTGETTRSSLAIRASSPVTIGSSGIPGVTAGAGASGMAAGTGRRSRRLRRANAAPLAASGCSSRSSCASRPSARSGRPSARRAGRRRPAVRAPPGPRRAGRWRFPRPGAGRRSRPWAAGARPSSFAAQCSLRSCRGEQPPRCRRGGGSSADRRGVVRRA
jgi:hypothetical protein